jgi:hypothetical protein
MVQRRAGVLEPFADYATVSLPEYKLVDRSLDTVGEDDVPVVRKSDRVDRSLFFFGDQRERTPNRRINSMAMSAPAGHNTHG